MAAKRWVITVTNHHGAVLDRWTANDKANHEKNLKIARDRYPLEVITVTTEKPKFDLSSFLGN